ncbi:MAG: cupin domain-containing protein [Gammaproteobacteria bacterium]|jgi:mannose-6-phosphate isomerase-like protein (cupin superfamily)
MTDNDLVRPAYFKLPVDREAVAAEWNERGYSCHDFVDPPGRAWLDFLHDCNELLTVVEGRLELEMKGKRLSLSPGDEVFIPKGASHSVFNVHDSATTWLYGYD